MHIYYGFEKTECDPNDENVWCLMLKEAENNNVDVLETFKIEMLFYQSITNIESWKH